MISLSDRTNTPRCLSIEADDLDSDREPDLHSAVVGERVQAIVSGGEDQDSASLYEISDSASDAEELSDAEREGEEDFGIEKVLVRGTATTRKGKNIATQLQQGVSIWSLPRLLYSLTPGVTPMLRPP